MVSSRNQRISLLLYVLLYYYSTWWVAWLVDGLVGGWVCRVAHGWVFPCLWEVVPSF